MSTVLPLNMGFRGNDRMIVRFTSITSRSLIIARLSESNKITAQASSMQFFVSACIISQFLAVAILNGRLISDWSIEDMNFDMTPYWMSLNVSVLQKTEKLKKISKFNQIGEN